MSKKQDAIYFDNFIACAQYASQAAQLLKDGKEAFVQLYNFLQNYDPARPGELCMAGFVLKNTLSDNGAVTRGICRMDENACLTGVDETSGIEKTADGGAAVAGAPIDAESLVSMNMWGLTPGFVGMLEQGFVEFFGTIAGNEMKAEYLLPIFIDELLKAGKVTVKVLPTHDRWFGVTYQEDKPVVIESFARLIEAGVYRKDLFSDLKQ